MQSTDQMLSRFYTIFLNLNCSTNISLTCSPSVTMVALVFWIACTCSGCTYCHFYSYAGFTIHGQCLYQMKKNEIMSGNQSDYVTLMLSWRRKKFDFFIVHFLNSLDTTRSKPWTVVHFKEVPMSRSILNKAPCILYIFENIYKISTCNTINYTKKNIYFIAEIWTIFLVTTSMCDCGRTITPMQIPWLHTQLWYNSHEHCLCPYISIYMLNTRFPFYFS